MREEAERRNGGYRFGIVEERIWAQDVSIARKCCQSEITSPARVYRISQRAPWKKVSLQFNIFSSYLYFCLPRRVQHKIDLTKINLAGPASGEMSLREKFRLQFDNFDCDSPVQLSSKPSRCFFLPLISFPISLFETKQ